MRIIFLIFCLFSFSFSKCDGTEFSIFAKPNKSKYDKNNPNDVKEMDMIRKIITINLNNRLSRFKNQNLETKVLIKVNELGEYCFKITEYSKNNEFNQVIQNFLNEESEKKYYENPKFKSILFTFKSD